MKEVIFPQALSGSPDSPEWHAWRAQGIGASDAPVIAADAGLTNRSTWMMTVHELWEIKIGVRAGPKMNPAMLRGKKFEERARQLYEERSGNIVSSMFGENDDHPELRASFDGVSFDRRLNVEIKVPGKDTHEAAKEGRAPGYYEAQMAYQCLVLWGDPADWPADGQVDFVSYRPADKDKGLEEDIAIVTYGAHEQEARVRMAGLTAIAGNLMPLALKFWKHVELKTPPGQSMDDWSLAAHEYRKAEEAETLAKAIKEKAKVKLMELVGDSPKRSGAGVTVSTYMQQGSVDYKKVLDVMVPRDAVKSIIEAAGIKSDDMLEKIMDGLKPTDDFLKAFRGAESSRTKITVEKDYVAPMADLVMVNIIKTENTGEKSYAW